MFICGSAAECLRWRWVYQSWASTCCLRAINVDYVEYVNWLHAWHKRLCPPKCPLPYPPNICFLGLTRVQSPNGTRIVSAERLTIVSNRHMNNGSSVTIGHIFVLCMQCGLTITTTACICIALFAITCIKLSAWKLMSRISKFCLDEWHVIWDCYQGNKLTLHDS